MRVQLMSEGGFHVLESRDPAGRLLQHSVFSFWPGRARTGLRLVVFASATAAPGMPCDGRRLEKLLQSVQTAQWQDTHADLRVVVADNGSGCAQQLASAIKRGFSWELGRAELIVVPPFPVPGTATGAPSEAASRAELVAWLDRWDEWDGSPRRPYSSDDEASSRQTGPWYS